MTFMFKIDEVHVTPPPPPYPLPTKRVPVFLTLSCTLCCGLLWHCMTFMFKIDEMHVTPRHIHCPQREYPSSLHCRAHYVVEFSGTVWPLCLRLMTCMWPPPYPLPTKRVPVFLTLSCTLCCGILWHCMTFMFKIDEMHVTPRHIHCPQREYPSSLHCRAHYVVEFSGTVWPLCLRLMTCMWPPAISTAHKESTRLPYIVVHTMLWNSLALYDLYV